MRFKKLIGLLGIGVMLSPLAASAAWTLSQNNKYFQRFTGDSVDASGSNSSTALEVGATAQFDIQVVHASHDDTSTWALDWSNDGGTTYERITTQTTSGASGSTSVTVDGMPGQIARITVTETDGNASATLTPYVTIKRKAR